LPVFVPQENIPAIIERLKQENIKAEKLHFDVNRNIFNPSYKECLVVPCHQYLKEKDLETIVGVVNSA
jgi:hypothetical protein